jgi:hypothetical protein
MSRDINRLFILIILHCTVVAQIEGSLRQRSVQPVRSGVLRCLKPLQGKTAASQTDCIYNSLRPL